MIHTKRIAITVLLLQIILFVLGTIYIAWALRQLVLAGAGFVPGFEAIETRRLIATLAPYMALPFSAILSFVFIIRQRYRASVSFPIAATVCALVLGRLYLLIVPDPVVDNFGARPQPYVGYLILPADKLPEGFSEVSHHYTKSEYDIRFRRMMDDKPVELDIVESPITKFVVDEANFAQSFDYEGIVGRIYVSHNPKRGQVTYNLVWLNPPQQRLSIYLTQPEGSDYYSADDLIHLVQSLHPAP